MPPMTDTSITNEPLRGPKQWLLKFGYSRRVLGLRYHLRRHPEDAEAGWHLGNYYRLLGRPKAAAAAFERVLKVKPAYYAAMLSLGDCALDLEEPDQGLELYRRVLDRYPGDPVASTRQAMCLKNAGLTDEAMTILDDLLRRNPADSEAMAMYVECHFARGEWELALDLARRAYAAGSPNLHFHRSVSEALIRLDRFEEAIAHLRILVRESPWDTRSVILLGDCLFRSGKNDEAFGEYLVAFLQSPRSPFVHEGLARVMFMNGQYRWALFHYRRSRRDPVSRKVSELGMGVCYLRLGKPGQALDLCLTVEKFLDIETFRTDEEAQLHHTIGACSVALGLREGALARYDRLLPLHPHWARLLRDEIVGRWPQCAEDLPPPAPVEDDGSPGSPFRP